MNFRKISLIFLIMTVVTSQVGAFPETTNQQGDTDDYVFYWTTDSRDVRLLAIVTERDNAIRSRRLDSPAPIGFQLAFFNLRNDMSAIYSELNTRQEAISREHAEKIFSIAESSKTLFDLAAAKETDAVLGDNGALLYRIYLYLNLLKVLSR